MAEDNKDDKGKTSTAWNVKEETILIETLVQQKIAGNWGDNNPKKMAWTACETALAGTVAPKSANSIKNCWQRVGFFYLNICAYIHIYSSLKRSTRS